MSELEDFDFDTGLADVADLVGYLNPADGTHVYAIVYAGPDMSRGDDPKRCMSIVYQKLGTVDLADENAIDSPIGSIIKESFSGNKMAKEILKMRLTQIYGKENMNKAASEGKTFVGMLKELNTETKNECYVQLVTKIQSSVSKKDKKTVYENLRIQDLQIIPRDSVDLPAGFEFFEYEPQMDDGIE